MVRCPSRFANEIEHILGQVPCLSRIFKQRENSSFSSALALLHIHTCHSQVYCWHFRQYEKGVIGWIMLRYVVEYAKQSASKTRLLYWWSFLCMHLILCFSKKFSNTKKQALLSLWYYGEKRRRMDVNGFFYSLKNTNCNQGRCVFVSDFWIWSRAVRRSKLRTMKI